MMKKVIAICVVEGTKGFMDEVAKFIQIAKKKGVELPDALSFKEEGEFATLSFPVIKNGIELGDFQISALKTMTDTEMFNLMREEVNKIEDTVTEGCFERNIQGKLSFKCNVPGLEFNGSLKREFLKGMIAKGEAVAKVIAEAC